MARHLAMGEMGEEMAASHLAEAGLRIVARRVRTRRGELDIVARDGEAWVFIEVRLRSSARYGRAAETFSPRKKERFRRAIEDYMFANNLERAEIRCDFVAIDREDGEFVLRHYPGGITFP